MVLITINHGQRVHASTLIPTHFPTTRSVWLYIKIELSTWHDRKWAGVETEAHKWRTALSSGHQRQILQSWPLHLFTSTAVRFGS